MLLTKLRSSMVTKYFTLRVSTNLLPCQNLNVLRTLTDYLKHDLSLIITMKTSLR